MWRESGLMVKPSDTLGEIEQLLALPANAPPGIVGTVIGHGMGGALGSIIWP